LKNLLKVEDEFSSDFNLILLSPTHRYQQPLRPAPVTLFYVTLYRRFWQIRLVCVAVNGVPLELWLQSRFWNFC
jgi:hypothetical protein